MSMKSAQVEELLGNTIVAWSGKEGFDTIRLKLSDGRKFVMLHDQDCCEQVRIEDICGDPQDLIGYPLLQAEESSSNDIIEGKPESPESFTWTFYRFATVRGAVTVRWLGESNGYYSESVDCYWEE